MRNAPMPLKVWVSSGQECGFVSLHIGPGDNLMAKKDKQGITQKQYVTLSDVSAGLGTLDVYGKIIQNTNVEPGSEWNSPSNRWE